MRFILMLVGLGLVVWVIQTKQAAKKAAELPPPPPPEIINQPPTPVLPTAEVQKVIDTARDPDPNVRWESLKFLSQLNIPQMDAILAEKLTRDPDTGVRRNVLNLILDRRGPRTSEFLVMALKDESPDVRVTALQALSRQGDFNTASSISQVLNDPDQRVKLAALAALNSLQSKRNEELKQKQQEAERARQEYIRKQEEAKNK